MPKPNIKWIIFYNDMDLWKDPNLKQWPKRKTIKIIYKIDMLQNVMDRLQTSVELQDKTSFIDPSTGVGLLKGCSPNYLLL